MPLPDGTLPLQRAVSPSIKLIESTYAAILDIASPENRRLAVALEWHASVMANSPAVTIQQRIIALKTAFEALVVESDSRKGARLLQQHFERATQKFS